MQKLVAFIGVLSCLVGVEALAQPAALLTRETVEMPRGIHTKWDIKDSLNIGMGQNILNNPGIVLIELNAEWKELEPTKGQYQFAGIVARLEEAKAAGLKVMLGLVLSGVSAPDYLNTYIPVDGVPSPRVSLYSPRKSSWQTVPVFWDQSTAYQSRLKELYAALAAYPTDSSGTPLRDHPALVAVKVGVLGLDWAEMLIVNSLDDTSAQNAIDAGYTPEKALQSSKDIIWNVGKRFPRQKLRVTYHRNLIDKRFPPNDESTMATQVLAFAQTYSDEYVTLGNRLLSQIDFWGGTHPIASADAVNGAAPGSWNYLYKLLKVYAPHIGIEMLNNAFKKDDASWCGLNHPAPCDPPVKVMETELSRAMTYSPQFITVWRDDGMLLNATPATVVAFGALYTKYTCAMGGTPRWRVMCH